jgi:predicted DNA-binding protein (MmcQ/YjbR family)
MVLLTGNFRNTRAPNRSGKGDTAAVDAGRLRDHCLAKPGAWLDQPWEGDHVVKVGTKIFAFLGADSVGLKCAASRDEADEWLERYPGDARVMPYIGRSGWNTLAIGKAIPDEEILEAVDASYDYVVAKLPRRERPA